MNGQLDARMMRGFFLAFLVSATCAPVCLPTCRQFVTRARATFATRADVVRSVFPCHASLGVPLLEHHVTIAASEGASHWEQHWTPPNQRGRHDVMGGAAVYWRRGQRLSNFSDSHIDDMWEFWEKAGVCRWWRGCVAQCHEGRCEVAAGCHLCGCILAAPIVGAGVLAAKCVGYMMPSSTECLRCGSEAFLLWSMWQGYDTKCVAVFGWLSWLGDLHCSTTLRCRGCTWLLVCLAQKDLYTSRLVVLSVLSLCTPLYGKRAEEIVRAGTSKKQRTASTTQAAAASLRAGVGDSLRNARRCGALDVQLQPRQNTDLSHAFPFVPQLLLAVLMSAYSPEGLQAVLSTERVRSLQIWGDFSNDVLMAAEDERPDAEQEVCDAYLRRFANVCASVESVPVKTEAARVLELRGQGMTFGSARGDGNCLISSLLQGLTHADLLPKALTENPLRLLAEVPRWRAAPVALSLVGGMRTAGPGGVGGGGEGRRGF